MKTNSDFEQSKMLAEFLSVESADLMFVHTTDLEGNEHYDIDFRNNQPLLEGDIPCWSLVGRLLHCLILFRWCVLIISSMIQQNRRSRIVYSPKPIIHLKRLITTILSMLVLI